jgi:hypothetical protein
LHEALLEVGATAGETAWGVPVRSPDLLLPSQTVLEEWNHVYNGHGADALLTHLVRQIRTWRPSVVLVPSGRSSDGLPQIVQQSVVAAVKLAGDPTFLAAQFGPAGCDPWNVERVYFVSPQLPGDGQIVRASYPSPPLGDGQTVRASYSPLPPGEGQGVRALGKVALAADDWSAQLGRTWADVALPARALLDDEYQAGPAMASVELIASRAPVDGTSAQGTGRPRFGELANRIDIMAGVASTGGPSRRSLTDGDRASGALDGLAQGRQTQAIFEQLQHDPEMVYERLLRGGELSQGIDASAAATLTFRIAQGFRHVGRSELADKTLALLIERFPLDPLARAAVLWRFQSLAASERPAVESSGSLAGNTASGPQKSRYEQALALAREIEVNRPELFAAPAVRYPLAAVYRQMGQDAQAQRLYALDHRGADRDVWWDCARGETWLLNRKGASPKPLASCVSVLERPHLDGRLDEALWKKCQPIVLSSPRGDDRAWPATLLLAHDEQYLYVAVQCRQAPGVRYETTTEMRPRDPDLSQHDRVDIFLDLDRGYATCYHLTIDHRGWAADALGSDPSWNPRWFVAAQMSDGVWTAEAAIPLAELKAAIVPGKTIWALGVQRTVPGVGFQSWTTPAATTVAPEAFGWLGFE